MLQDQWEEELELRFALAALSAGRVLVRPTGKSPADLAGTFQLVLIDEAQHVAALAFGSEPDRKTFAT